jgi:hypothetical protein
MQPHQIKATLQQKDSWAVSDSVVAAGLVSMFVLIYGIQVSDFPLLEDDGLFVLASEFLGTAHSPGYPLYILLSQVSHLLPLESAAFRVHLFGSFTASVALGLLYFIGRRVLHLEKVACLFGTICVAFSTLFWEQALIAEAYQLNGVLFLLLFALCAKLGSEQQPGGWPVLLTGFVFGLSLANHWPLTLLLAPTFALLAAPAVVTTLKLVPLGLVGILFGTSPYLWMFLSGSDTGFNHMGSFPGPSEFFYFISRDVYADVDQRQIASISDKALFTSFYVREMIGQFTMFTAPLVVVGIFRLARYMPVRFVSAILYSILFPLVVIVLLDFTYTPIETASMGAYFLPVYLVMGMMLMAGASALLNWLSDLRVITGPILILFMALVIQQNHHIAAGNPSDFGREQSNYVLSRLPQGANLFVMDSWLMATVTYLHYVEQVRPDVHLYSQHGTFLPSRLFNYFELDARQKQQHVKEFIQRSDNPTFSLGNPDWYQMPYQDLAFAYRLNATGDEVQIRDLEFLEDQLLRPPQSSWEKLGYEATALRLSRFVTLGDLQEPLFSGNFIMNLIAAEQLLRSDSEDISAEQVAPFLARAEALVKDQSEFMQVRLQILKGHQMMRLGRYEVAQQFYESALSKLPVAHNTAILALANVYSLTCSIKALDDLQHMYTEVDLGRYGSQIGDCL